MKALAWERGHRVHGFWADTPRLPMRVGHVSLSPRGLPPVRYSWELDAVPEERGEESSLRAAKRRVEAAYQKHYSWHFRLVRKANVEAGKPANIQGDVILRGARHD